MDWDDPILKSLDLEYHDLHEAKGLYFGLVDEGRASRVTTDAAVRLAEEQPPRNTRAFGRGEVIRHLLECGPPPDDERGGDSRFLPPYVINWSAFHLRGHVPFLMPDPFKSYVHEIRGHLARQ